MFKKIVFFLTVAGAVGCVNRTNIRPTPTHVQQKPVYIQEDHKVNPMTLTETEKFQLLDLYSQHENSAYIAIVTADEIDGGDEGCEAEEYLNCPEDTGHVVCFCRPRLSKTAEK